MKMAWITLDCSETELDGVKEEIAKGLKAILPKYRFIITQKNFEIQEPKEILKALKQATKELQEMIKIVKGKKDVKHKYIN